MAGVDSRSHATAYLTKNNIVFPGPAEHEAELPQLADERRDDAYPVPTDDNEVSE